MAAGRDTLKVGTSGYGPVLYDGKGFVLYAFTHDANGKSRCSARAPRRGRRTSRRARRPAAACSSRCSAPPAAPTARSRSPRRPPALLLRRRPPARPDSLPEHRGVRRPLAGRPRQRQARPLTVATTSNRERQPRTRDLVAVQRSTLSAPGAGLAIPPVDRDRAQREPGHLLRRARAGRSTAAPAATPECSPTTASSSPDAATPSLRASAARPASAARRPESCGPRGRCDAGGHEALASDLGQEPERDGADRDPVGRVAEAHPQVEQQRALRRVDRR